MTQKKKQSLILKYKSYYNTMHIIIIFDWNSSLLAQQMMSPFDSFRILPTPSLKHMLHGLSNGYKNIQDLMKLILTAHWKSFLPLLSRTVFESQIGRQVLSMYTYFATIISWLFVIGPKSYNMRIRTMHQIIRTLVLESSVHFEQYVWFIKKVEHLSYVSKCILRTT